MTPKERAAMQQALEALELHLNGCGVAIATRIAYDSLREALAEQALQKLSDFHQSIEQWPTIADLDFDVGEKPTKEELANVLVPWYDREDSTNVLAEKAEQEPFDMNDHPPHRLCECRKCMEYFTPLPGCDAFAASGKPIAEQTNTQLMEGYRPVSEMIAEHKQDPKKAAAIEKAKMRKAEHEPVAFWNGKETAWFEHELCGHPAPDGCTIPLYTRPVRTKDMTDDEIMRVLFATPKKEGANMGLLYARAVIAADREKNK